jgi:hypothetical protein
MADRLRTPAAGWETTVRLAVMLCPAALDEERAMTGRIEYLGGTDYLLVNFFANYGSAQRK